MHVPYTAPHDGCRMQSPMPHSVDPAVTWEPRGRLGGTIVSTESAAEYSSAAKGETLEGVDGQACSVSDGSRYTKVLYSWFHID